MPTITWLGTDDPDLKETTGFRGMVFKKGEAVECEDPAFLSRAYNNRYFEVSGWEPKEAPTVDVTADVTVKPPSQQTAQYPVPKHGDVKTLEATVPNPPDPVAPESETVKSGFKPIPLK
jgi:hypothetical protein